MRIFVTGAGGFIGRAFCAEALARGHALSYLGRGGPIEGLEAATLVKGELHTIDQGAVERLRPDVLLHLAWIAAPGEYLDSPLNDVLADQSIAMMAELAKRGVAHLAGVGTCIEYAPSEQPLCEVSSETFAEFPYSIAKHRLHKWMVSRDWGTDTTWSWLRVFYPYGPGEHPLRLASSFATRLAAREAVVLRTPDSVKDFIYLSDLACALCDALEARVVGAVNLGTGRGASIRELAEIVARAVDAPTALVRDAEDRAVDPRPFVVADTTRIRATGWCPRVSLAEGVENLVRSLGRADR